MRKLKNRHGFLIFTVIWILLLSLTGGAVILYLRSYLAEYESARPQHVIDVFEEKLVSGNVDEAALSVLDEIDPALQTREEALAFLKEILSSAKLYKAVDECTDDLYVYRIKSGTSLIGRAVMTVSGKTAHGLKLWNVSSCDLDFASFINICAVTVPENYSVQLNGKTLDPSYISQSGIKYDTLSPFYDSYNNLPTLVRYTAGKVLGEAELTVMAPDGSIQDASALTEKDFLNIAYRADRDTELRELTSEFVARYADYTSNVTGYTAANYSAIKTLVVPESELHNRLRLAFDAMGYIWAKECEIIREDIHIVSRLSPDLYMTDVSYIVETDGGRSDSNIRLIIVPDEKGTLKAETMSTY